LKETKEPTVIIRVRLKSKNDQNTNAIPKILYFSFSAAPKLWEMT
jgi:hypothetical protein